MRFLALLSILFVVALSQADPTVTTRDGDVIGVEVDDVTQFLGVPYAAPPTGANRWRETQPNTPWTVAKFARTMPPLCPQSIPSENPWSIPWGKFPLVASDFSEDCLYLNIYVPQKGCCDNDARRPVVVWFHGGDLSSGGNLLAYADGSEFAEEENVVVVTVQYRLGVFGFFSSLLLLGETSAYPSTGNYGFNDQVVALQWIRDNILNFGGDPEKITIAGQSTGGASVAWHQVSPLSRAVPERVILQSPPVFAYVKSIDEHISESLPTAAALVAAAIADRGLECNVFTPCAAGNLSACGVLLDCWRSVPATTLTTLPFSPAIAVDGHFFPEHPLVAFNEGRYRRLPALIGHTSFEGSLSVFAPGDSAWDQSDFEDWANNFYDSETAPLVIAKYQCAAYSAINPPDCRMAAAAAIGDQSVVCPTQILIQLFNRYQPDKMAAYLWDHAPSYNQPYIPQLGAWQGSELEYIFDNLRDGEIDQEEDLVDEIRKRWGAFIRGEQRPQGWPKYEYPTKDRLKFEIQDNGGVQKIVGLDDGVCSFWNPMYPVAAGLTGFSYNIQTTPSAPIYTTDYLPPYGIGLVIAGGVCIGINFILIVGICYVSLKDD